MIARKSLNDTFTSDLQDFIGSASVSGRYGNASEVVRAALRLSEERETNYHHYRAARDGSPANGAY